MAVREIHKELLPLKWATPERWVATALADPLELLNNHAHLEKKAAANALALLPCWPAPNPPERWVETMTSVANDEAAHLHQVTRLLLRRGGQMSRLDNNPYARELNELVRKGKGTYELMDRLMVSALIEARSCERFYLLATHCDDSELAKLYEGLYKSEAGHYRQFIDLARELPGVSGVDERWDEMLAAEAEIIQKQKPGSGMHTGVAEAE